MFDFISSKWYVKGSVIAILGILVCVLAYITKTASDKREEFFQKAIRNLKIYIQEALSLSDDQFVQLIAGAYVFLSITEEDFKRILTNEFRGISPKQREEIVMKFNKEKDNLRNFLHLIRADEIVAEIKNSKILMLITSFLKDQNNCLFVHSHILSIDRI